MIHNGATILHHNTKVLVNQGLFVFLVVKNNPFSPLHLFQDLYLSRYKNLLKKKNCCDIIRIKRGGGEVSYMSGAGRAMADYLEAWDSVKYRKIIIGRNNSIKLYDV